MNIKKYFAFLVLAITTLTATAADKVYISDFSIKAGESKLIAVNFDSERTDLADVSTITLSNFTATTNNNASVSLECQNCTVTRETGQGGGDDPTPVSSELSFSFSPATLKATNLAVTDAGAKSYQAEDIILPVTVQSQKNVALAFSSEQVSLTPGETATVDVTLTSEVDLTGFMGTLTLPAGITATMSKGAIINSLPKYNTTTGVMTYLGGMTAREGVLFTLTLTADNDFTASGELTFTNISTTTAGALSIVPADITMPVNLKTATGIDTVRTKSNDQWYDMKGRKLEGKPTKKGMYILNARKVVMK
jgi:hypothetical protein